MAHNLLETQDPAILNQIDWHIITNNICLHAHFEHTRKRLSLAPISKSAFEIEQELEKLTKLITNIEDLEFCIHSSIYRIASDESMLDLFNHLYKQKIFDIPQLHYICQNIEATQQLLKIIPFEQIFESQLEMQDITKMNSVFIKKFRLYVDPVNGYFDQEKHPDIRALHEKLFNIESSARKNLNIFKSNPKIANTLQYSEHTVVNDRYALAIKTDHFNHQIGQIIARSQSGDTVYVEPYEISKFNNDRINTLNEIDQVVFKICRQFSETLFPFTDSLIKIKNYNLAMDYYFAKAQYSVKKNLIRPTICHEKSIVLDDFFNPIINNPVKNDFTLVDEYCGFAITGPNAGGKTICLKTVALSLLSVHYGIFVPAWEAKIFPFEKIYFFGRDEQNIAQGLSSFTSECASYLKCTEEMDENSIIFIDEIFNSTSSKEASALAYSFIKFISNTKKSKVVLSTHHDDLKILLSKDPKFISASMGYEQDTYLPTYQLIIGYPGASLALEVFNNVSSKYNFAKEIYNFSKDLLSGKYLSLENIIKELHSEKQVLSQRIGEYEELLFSVQKKQMAFDLEKNQMLAREVDKIRKKYEVLLEETKQLIHIKRNDPFGSKKDIQAKLSSVNQSLSSEVETKKQVSKNLRDGNVDFEQILAGNKYFHKSFGKDVTIVSKNDRKKTLLVAFKNQKFWIKAEALAQCGGNKTDHKQTVTINVFKNNDEGSVEFDARGLRLDEFKSQIEKKIDDVRTGHLPYLEVIHGHGDGILKNWLKTYLYDQGDLDVNHPESNLGVSTIKLK